MSQTVLAAAADVSQSQMSKMLWGSRDITVEQLDAMCAALGIGIVDVVREAHDATDESGGAEGIA